MHEAKKIKAGEYEYRGFRIKRHALVPNYWDIYGPSDAQITQGDPDKYVVSNSKTLREGKMIVDMYYL